MSQGRGTAAEQLFCVMFYGVQFTPVRWRRADRCMGGLTKSDVLENGFHGRAGWLRGSLFVLLSPGLSPAASHQGCLPVGASDSWRSPFAQPHATAPIANLFPRQGGSALRTAATHRCPASGASRDFSRLGNGVDLCVAGLTGAGVGACTFPASVRGQGRFSPPAEGPGSLEAEHL